MGPFENWRQSLPKCIYYVDNSEFKNKFIKSCLKKKVNGSIDIIVLNSLFKFTAHCFKFTGRLVLFLKLNS